MPALPPVANVFKVALTGTVDPYNWAVILHAVWSGTTPGTAACAAFGTDVEAAWAAHMAALYPSVVVLQEVTFTDLTSTSGASGSWSGTEAGTGSGTPVAASSCYLVDYPSSFRYRGGHPRTYLPGSVAGNLVDMAHWSGSNVTSFQTAWNDVTAVLSSASSGGCSLTSQCAVSYVYTPVGGSPGTRRTTPLVMPIAANSSSVKAQLGSQRRRIGRK